MSQRRKASKVKVTYADGSVEVVNPGHFKKPKRQKKKGLSAYANYLRSSHWKRIRQQVLTRDDHRCQGCGCADRLQVHHLTYERVGKEQLADLTTLCRDCHRSHHKGCAR